MLFRFGELGEEGVPCGSVGVGVGERCDGTIALEFVDELAEGGENFFSLLMFLEGEGGGRGVG